MTNQNNKNNLEPNFIYEKRQWVIRGVPITPARKRLFQQAISPPNKYQAKYTKFTTKNYSKRKGIPNKYKKK